MTASNGNGNGVAKRVLKAGVWAPSPTFYDDNEELDLATLATHVVSLAKAGVQPVICGSMGESHHLTREERKAVIAAARAALDNAGYTDAVLIAGTGGNSTRATIALSQDAAEAGADIAIVIPPGYFSGALGKEALKTFFADVAAGSPIPVMIYNYPGAAGTIDLDSDTIVEIARENPNICGVKLTCGAVGKLTRITGATATPEFADKYPRAHPDVAPEFITLGGFADFLLPTVGAGRAHGAIMGLANVYPRGIARLFQLADKIATDAQPSKADLTKALKIQDLAAGADQTLARGGIAATKWWLKKHNGYPSARVRRPLLDFTDAAGEKIEADAIVAEFYELEKSLA
ncbi:hypothetical protein VHUM_01045 [Vanrija humicola]|uniref:Dihydrodipicolinate synthase n=1 Tax=Vanrija humicola TaxID=5417 RepID=A0A7D8V534_VANHU|nr:hypothetical protein VHUM_01045 [Vanrija humicola]